MNYVTSQSVGSGSDNHGCCGRDKKRRRRHNEQGDAILRANTGSFGPNTINIQQPTLQAVINEPIASVTIDTDKLDDPTILVQFLGTLTTTSSTPVGLSFVFTLFRNCKCQNREQLRSFTVSQAIALPNVPDSRGLSFAFTERDDDRCKDDCCTYTLELTRITATTPATITVTVNGTLSVLAVGEEEDEDDERDRDRY